ncbi:MAG: zinc dependent phospholipase C family protein, partial [Parafilimonas sp.]|nr:zinc dependent phospholipase C family protein [Parafilimonas sp.]
MVFVPCKSYSIGVLTHEAIIDAEWDSVLLPFLKQKFPSSTDSEFIFARAYAYGGAVTPDMGYYPFGSPLFTNLVHYVRSGDINEALLKYADSLNGFAFALGFLSHYYADVYGHPLA